MKIIFPALLSNRPHLAITSLEIVLKYAHSSAYIPTCPADFYIERQGKAQSAHFALFAITNANQEMEIEFDSNGFSRDFTAGEILEISVQAWCFYVEKGRHSGSQTFRYDLEALDFHNFELPLARFNPEEMKFSVPATFLGILDSPKPEKTFTAHHVPGLRGHEIVSYKRAYDLLSCFAFLGSARVPFTEAEKEARLSALEGHTVPLEDNPAWRKGEEWNGIVIEKHGHLNMICVSNGKWKYMPQMAQDDLRRRLFTELEKPGRDMMAEHVSRGLRIEKIKFLSDLNVGEEFQLVGNLYSDKFMVVPETYYKKMASSGGMINPLVRVL